MPTARNAKGVDIVADKSDAHSSKVIGIQVKSMRKHNDIKIGISDHKLDDLHGLIDLLFITGQ
jgi:hypothetical protein